MAYVSSAVLRCGRVDNSDADNRRLQIGEVVTTIPTIGFNVESVSYRNLNFNVWVSGGYIYGLA